MRALVGLLARVGPHVLLQLRRVAKALGALDAHVRKVLAVHGQQVAIEQALLSRLVVAVLAVVQLGLAVLDDELVGAQRAGLVVAPRVLGVLRRALAVVAQQLVALDVAVEADLLVGGEVAVGALVLLLEQVVRVVLHVAFEEAARAELFPTYVARVDGQRQPVRSDDNRWETWRTKRRREKNDEYQSGHICSSQQASLWPFYKRRMWRFSHQSDTVACLLSSFSWVLV